MSAAEGEWPITAPGLLGLYTCLLKSTLMEVLGCLPGAHRARVRLRLQVLLQDALLDRSSISCNYEIAQVSEGLQCVC